MPYSDHARQGLRQLAEEHSHHLLARQDADQLDLDYQQEDEAHNFGYIQQDVGGHHIALRFSAKVKLRSQGFTFGRNPGRCDICLKQDPRLSNIHFRIYLNEHGVLMIEDSSTNGTIVDEVLLRYKPVNQFPRKRTLNSGSKIKILLADNGNDLVFLVRVPRREGRHLAEYQRNLDVYMEMIGHQPVDANRTIVPGPGGHVSRSPNLYVSFSSLTVP